MWNKFLVNDRADEFTWVVLMCCMSSFEKKSFDVDC